MHLPKGLWPGRKAVLSQVLMSTCCGRARPLAPRLWSALSFQRTHPTVSFPHLINRAGLLYSMFPAMKHRPLNSRRFPIVSQPVCRGIGLGAHAWTFGLKFISFYCEVPYTLCFYSGPGTFLDAGARAANQTDRNPSPRGAYILVWGKNLQTYKQIR